MHTYFMKNWGGYLKDNYGCLDKMTKSDLCEAYEVAKTLKEIFKADKEYNEVVKLERMNDNADRKIELETDIEDIIKMIDGVYKTSDAETKTMMKELLMEIISS